MKHLTPLILLATLLLILVTGCLTLRPAKTTFHKAESYPAFQESGTRKSIKESVERSHNALKKLNSEKEVLLGAPSLTITDLIETLKVFRAILENAQNDEELRHQILKHFELYEIPEPVLFTGYYEPLIQGSLVQTDRFRYPLYRRPNDLGEKSKKTCLEIFPFPHKKRPYYTRKEIDTQGILSDQGLELLYLDDPVEKFFLHVQGAGSIQLPDHSVVRVQYGGNNGRPYTSLGKVLIQEGKLLPEEVTLPRIKEYLREHPEEQKRIMNTNDRYIFFKKSNLGPQGVNGIVLTPYRSLATDPAVIPTGSLCYYITPFPRFNNNGEFRGLKEQTGFAVSQDIGAAIRGGKRADLFLGAGPQAEAIAGHMKSEGKLYILIRKKESEQKGKLKKYYSDQ
jgi:membrane-bound lytic murein transglycosylase A